ncbi:RNA polymerase sigma factor [Sphingobium sp. BYY-5]|uniref:RNA polymerase sigma factor n=1 Tax=Sphingobium sp. BYY-5 TaxID=2926400 RepID=UPI001FA6F2BD|nr:RNA polymerase sigma factor [Sphingobium sp. BYY-5]MCI4592290.1 RNA polymerase sigma factor [Sphingobium sp. BYY-5]
MWKRLRRQVGRTVAAQDVDDHLQSAFLKFQSYQARKTVHNPEAFLVRAAANDAMDAYRYNRRRPTDSHYEEVVAMLADTTPLADEDLVIRQRLDRVREGVAKLTPRTREVFLLHRLEGLKYHEIAKRLAISESAVEKHVAKAALFLAQWAKGW